jgi:hypothetical protein
MEKKHTIHMEFTPDRYAIISRQAKIVGLTPTAYARHLVLSNVYEAEEQEIEKNRKV